MGLTSYGDQQALKSLFGGGAATLPATLYFGLSQTTISIDGTGITEPSGGAYQRVAVTNNGTNFTVTQIATGSGGGAQVQNAAPITFPQSTASWGTVTYWFACDGGATGATGNIIAYGALSASQTVSTNNTLSFAANALTIQDV